VQPREVHFKASNGLLLDAWLYGHGKTAVVCAHAFGESKVAWDLLVRRLVPAGYMVLAFDFEGHGGSQGSKSFGNLVIDLRAAIDFVRQQGAEKLVLAGASMGGWAALNYASAARGSVEAVVTLSAPLSLGMELTDAELRSSSMPKLFMNTTFDDFADDTNHMYAVAGQPKELRMYKGRAHGTDMFDGEPFSDDALATIMAFIKRYAPNS
jgi:pimeloyl-ACP methyl ester carboxylesterase